MGPLQIVFHLGELALQLSLLLEPGPGLVGERLIALGELGLEGDQAILQLLQVLFEILDACFGLEISQVELFFRCLNGLLGLLQFALRFNEACFRSR